MFFQTIERFKIEAIQSKIKRHRVVTALFAGLSGVIRWIFFLSFIFIYLFVCVFIYFCIHYLFVYLFVYSCIYCLHIIGVFII